MGVFCIVSPTKLKPGFVSLKKILCNTDEYMQETIPHKWISFKMTGYEEVALLFS